MFAFGALARARCCAHLLAACVLASGCYRYNPETLTALEAGQIAEGTRLRLTYREPGPKPAEIDLERLELPYISGIVYVRGDAPGDRIAQHRRIDLRQVESIEVQQVDGTLTTVAIVLGAVVLVGSAVLLFTLTFSPWGP